MKIFIVYEKAIGKLFHLNTWEIPHLIKAFISREKAESFIFKTKYRNTERKAYMDLWEAQDLCFDEDVDSFNNNLTIDQLIIIQKFYPEFNFSENNIIKDPFSIECDFVPREFFNEYEIIETILED